MPKFVFHENFVRRRVKFYNLYQFAVHFYDNRLIFAENIAGCSN